MANYTLRLHTPYMATDSKTIILDTLSGVRDSWEREENAFGFYQGFFSIEGGDITLKQLIDYQRQWLGYEVRENVGGRSQWEGYIHEMRLYHGDVCRVYGYDVGGEKDRDPNGMYNAVRCEIGSLVANKEFEIDGSAPPVFEDWSQNIDTGDSITQETTDPAKGGKSPKLTNGGGGDTYIYQNVTVTENTTYQIRFASCGDGSVAGRYRFYDVTNATDIVPTTSTDNTGLGQFRNVTEEIVTPGGCVSLRIYFYVPSAAGFAIFDSVDVRKIEDGTAGKSYTAWATQDQSITRHGRREITLSGNGLTAAEAEQKRDAFLAARAWPQERQENGDGSTRLDVYVQGYIHRASWLKTDSDIDGVTDAASDHVTTISGKLPWVSSTIIKTNSGNVTMQQTSQSLLDALRDVVDAGDSSGNMWRCYMDRNRTLIYEQVDFTPRLAQANGKIYNKLGDRQTASDRLIRAMWVIRSYDFPDTTSLPGSLLNQRNDSLLESVTVGPNGLRRNL